REQSPIDLTSATQTDLPAMDSRVAGQQGISDLIDNGHGIQINAKPGDLLTVGDDTYALLQFHFHAPSEHTVEGDHFPMEIHFVHRAENGALAVIGVFVEEGAQNSVIAPITEQLTHLTDNAATVEIPAGLADAIFPSGSSGFYHYDGSLTTPPCSEGLKWYVSKTPTLLSKDQIAAFTAIYDHNNRPVQPLNARTLYRDENPIVTVH
ncbi:MAG: carbonic anhydrase family protein, partial [Gammaproteobacteria bacterium]|nr:carbonic anhydrase family protein [Gammaproteobacteria bacterium]